MNEDIYVKVREVLISSLKKNIQDIQPESNLKDDLGLDSMTSLTFLMALEDNIPGFVVDPATLEMEHMFNLATITDYVTTQLASQHVS